MADALPVRVNHDRPNSIAAATATFETDGSFVVALQNHGQAAHVHVQLDDALSRVASVDGSNHFVETESTTTVPVRIHTDRRPVRGKLKVVTGYGRETEYVTVDLSEPDEPTVTGDVTRADAGTRGWLADLPIAMLDDESVPVVALGGVALLVALGAATVTDALAVQAGVVAVLASLALAVYLLST